MTAMQPAGWYPNPDGSPTQRWWDGGQWTPQTRPLGFAGVSPPPTGRNTKRPLVLGTAAFAILAVAVASLLLVNSRLTKPERGVSGNPNEWVASVCEGMLPFDLANPADDNFYNRRCNAREGNGWVHIYGYSHNGPLYQQFKEMAYLEHLQPSFAAVKLREDEYWLLVGLLIGGDDEHDQTYTTALLKPLEKFGFKPEPYTAVPEHWPDFVME